MLEVSARIRRVLAYMPVTFTGGVQKLVLEGVARATYDSACCFCERLSARLDTHEPQAYRVHAPVVNTADTPWASRPRARSLTDVELDQSVMPSHLCRIILLKYSERHGFLTVKVGRVFPCMLSLMQHTIELDSETSFTILSLINASTITL